MKWISVKDSLPGPELQHIWVLVCVEDTKDKAMSKFFIASYSRKGGWYFWGGEETTFAPGGGDECWSIKKRDITHWMEIEVPVS